jgi:hypothetical protein
VIEHCETEGIEGKALQGVAGVLGRRLTDPGGV